MTSEKDNNNKRRKYRPVSILEGIEEIRQDFEERIAQGDITYGLEILDDAVETVRKGSITFIIAAPNTGKSLLGLRIAVHFAKQNKRVLICSCEMGAGLLMEREIKRDYYLEQLIKRKGNGLIKIVTGIRRCGKSYLLRTLFKNHLIESGVDEEHIIEMAFDLFDNIILSLIALVVNSLFLQSILSISIKGGRKQMRIK